MGDFIYNLNFNINLDDDNFNINLNNNHINKYKHVYLDVNDYQHVYLDDCVERSNMEEQIIIYNPRDGKPVKDFPWAMAKWSLGVNKMGKFPENVGRELLKRCGFLREIEPENIKEVMEEMKEKKFKCPHCDYETDSELKLKGHLLGKHKLSKETKEALDGIPAVEPERVASQGVPPLKTKLTPEEEEDIPKGETGGWYGKGLEDDVPSSLGTRKVGTPGNFGAS